MQLRKHTDAADEAQRTRCELNTRPELTEAERATCLYHALCAAVQAGDKAKARRLALRLRGLIQYLPEGK